jgi:hypothetical protein
MTPRRDLSTRSMQGYAGTVTRDTRSMRRVPTSALLSIAGFLLWALPAQAQIVVVQTPVTFSGNDPTVTFGSNWTAGNHVQVIAISSTQTDTVNITGITETETEFLGPGVLSSRRAWGFCFEVDGSSDNDMVMTTSANASVSGYAVEVSGGTCTMDGSDIDDGDSGSNHVLDPGVTTSVCGSVVLGLIQATNTANFTADGDYVSVPLSGTDFASSTMLGEYLITTETGTYTAPFTNSSEITSHVAFAVSPAIPCGGGGGRAPCVIGGGLMRPGCPGSVQ